MASIDDPVFAPTLTLPFPVGESPFRQKGNSYLGDVRYLDSCVPGGFDAAVAALPDPALRAFFQQPFRPSDWYDSYPGMQLEMTAARLCGTSFSAHRRKTGAWHAEHAARGLYGTLLRFISSENVALWAPRISSLYFEFGRTETRVVGAGEIAATRRGIPRELVQWIIFASVGFCEKTLHISGATRAAIDIGEVEHDAHAHGRQLMRVNLCVRLGTTLR
jgi:hypothetical protein